MRRRRRAQSLVGLGNFGGRHLFLRVAHEEISGTVVTPPAALRCSLCSGCLRALSLSLVTVSRMALRSYVRISSYMLFVL